MEQTDDRRRRRLVVERGFQFKLALRICLIASGIFVAFGGGLLFLIKMNYEMLVQNALLQMPEMVSQLQREFRILSLVIVSVMIFMVAVMFGLGLVLTQRFAGPLFAFKRQLKGISEGRASVRLSLRMGDEFFDLAEAFNHAMESLESRERRRETEIRGAIAALNANRPSEAAQKLESTLKT